MPKLDDTKMGNQAKKGTNNVMSATERFLDLIGVDKKMQSEPEKVKKVLRIMSLDDFEQTDDLFGELLSKSTDMSGFIQDVQGAVETKHPAIEKFLGCAIKQGLIAKNDEIHEHVETAIYVTYILNKLCWQMNGEIAFMYELKEHYIQKREQALQAKRGTLDYWKGIAQKAGGLFEILKIRTMDSVYDQYAEFREKGDLSRRDLIRKNIGLKINIGEAVLEDFRQGFGANAKVGVKLMGSPMKKIYTAGDKNAVKQVFQKNWTYIYETWNLAFVTANIDDLHLILPKLLFPLIIAAEEEDYLFYRGFTLWLALNYIVLRRINGEKGIELPSAKRLAEIWGEVNLKYASDVGL